MKRSYDLMDFLEESYMVPLSDPMYGGDNNFEDKMNQIVAWCEERCQGEYIIMMNNVVFKFSEDAMFFRMGYKYHG